MKVKNADELPIFSKLKIPINEPNKNAIFPYDAGPRRRANKTPVVKLNKLLKKFVPIVKRKRFLIRAFIKM